MVTGFNLMARDELTGRCWMLFGARYKEAEKWKTVGGLEE